MKLFDCSTREELKVDRLVGKHPVGKIQAISEPDPTGSVTVLWSGDTEPTKHTPAEIGAIFK